MIPCLLSLDTLRRWGVGYRELVTMRNLRSDDDDDDHAWTVESFPNSCSLNICAHFFPYISPNPSAGKISNVENSSWYLHHI